MFRRKIMSSNSLLFKKIVCVCALSTCVQICALMYRYAEAREGCWVFGYLPLLLSVLFLILLWNLEFANFWRGWELASPSNLLEYHPPPTQHTHSTGAAGMSGHYWIFMWILGVRTKILKFTQVC